MSVIPFDIPVPLSVSAGAWTSVQDLIGKWIGISGTFTATIQFQWSRDGDTANAVSIGSPVTAAGTLQAPPEGGWIRANVTAYTSGTPIARGTGRNT